MSEDRMRHLKKDDCLLMVVDIQERLLPAIYEADRVSRQSVKLIEGAKILGVPIVWTEQYKKGLGESTPEIRQAIGDSAKPLEKLTFGCLADEGIAAEVQRQGRKAVVLCGIETHICVMQTAFSALDKGLTVALAEDAVSSRRAGDHETGLARMRAAGVVPATVEMLFMEWMEVAGTDTFKRMLPLLKN
jgi:nicotinamidase-related amidase